MSSANTSHGAGAGLKSYGFKKDDEKEAEFESQYVKVVERRSSRWAEVLGEEVSPGDGRVKRFIRKGIPQELRPKLWPLVSGAEDAMKKRSGEYGRLCRVEAAEGASRQIDLDLHRTFPDNQHFQNMSLGMKEGLAQVLHCVATKHPSVGYCQGLNYIAGLLLLVTESEETSFYLLESVLQEIPDYYTPGMRGLRVDVAVLRELLRQRSRELDALFDRLQFDLLLVTSKWFICWFMETVLRVWDCLFHEGPKILFRVALTLLLKNKARLLAVKSFPELVEILQQVASDDYALNAHQFVQDIFSVPGTLSGKTIEQLRQKHSLLLKQQDNA